MEPCALAVPARYSLARHSRNLGPVRSEFIQKGPGAKGEDSAIPGIAAVGQELFRPLKIGLFDKLRDLEAQRADRLARVGQVVADRVRARGLGRRGNTREGGGERLGRHAEREIGNMKTELHGDPSKDAAAAATKMLASANVILAGASTALTAAAKEAKTAATEVGAAKQALIDAASLHAAMDKKLAMLRILLIVALVSEPILFALIHFFRQP